MIRAEPHEMTIRAEPHEMTIRAEPHEMTIRAEPHEMTIRAEPHELLYFAGQVRGWITNSPSDNALALASRFVRLALTKIHHQV
jgi:hypothetical protein